MMDFEDMFHSKEVENILKLSNICLKRCQIFLIPIFIVVILGWIYNINMNNTGNNQFALNQTRNYKEQDFSPNKLPLQIYENPLKCDQNHLFIDSIQKNPTSDFDDHCKSGKLEKKSRCKVDWTPEEDATLFVNYIKQGSKWAQLSKILWNKTQNSIKNRFYCCIRKVQKKINLIQKKKKIHHRKLVSLESLLTFLQLGKSCLNYLDGRFKNANQHAPQIMEVKQAIIEEAMKPEAQLNESKIENILVQILKLKHSLKFINVKRVKKTHKLSQSEASTTQLVMKEQSEQKDVMNEAETVAKTCEDEASKNQHQMMEEQIELIDYTMEKLQKKESQKKCENGMLCLDWESFDHDHLFII